MCTTHTKINISSAEKRSWRGFECWMLNWRDFIVWYRVNDDEVERVFDLGQVRQRNNNKVVVSNFQKREKKRASVQKMWISLFILDSLIYANITHETWTCGKENREDDEKFTSETSDEISKSSYEENRAICYFSLFFAFLDSKKKINQRVHEPRSFLLHTLRHKCQQHMKIEFFHLCPTFDEDEWDSHWIR